MTKFKIDTRADDGWAVMWESRNRLNGKTVFLIGVAGNLEPRPAWLRGYRTMVFETRREAGAYIKNKYSYIAKRKDLRTEPHGWRVPKAVRVQVSVVRVP